MMFGLTKKEEVLPPVEQQIGDLVRGLVERKANETEERGMIRLGERLAAHPSRDRDGEMCMTVTSGSSALSARNAADARTIASALTAFADAIDPKAA